MYDEDDIPLTLEEQEAYNVNSLGQEVDDEELEDEEDTSIDYTEDPDSTNLDLDC